jgi:hypothetical protein
MVNKPHEPTEKEREAVEIMAGHGIPPIDIARVLGHSESTIRRHYTQELDTGHIRANSKVAQSLFDKAMANGPGAVTACIFWLKVRAGWLEAQPPTQPVGRKELQQRAAETAGGGEWADDLNTEVRAN